MSMKRSRWILGTMIGLIALSSVGVATSLAWYQGANHLMVSTLEIELGGDNELLLGTSPNIDAMKPKLTTSDLNGVGVFMPVSTMFQSRWRGGGKLPEFYEYGGLTHVSAEGVPSDPAAKKGGYFSESIYMYSDRGVYVGLDPASCFVCAYEAANKASAKNLTKSLPYSEEEIVTRLNSLEKAMRFSIYDVSEDKFLIVDPFKEGPTYYAGILDVSGTGTYDTYLDGEGHKKEVLYGEVNDRSLVTHGSSINEKALDYNGELTCFNSGHDGDTYLYDEEASFAAGLTYAEEQSVKLDESYGDIDIENNPFVLKVTPFEVKQLVISIYIEGWDRDCVNANMGGSFLSQIQFKTLREVIV